MDSIRIQGLKVDCIIGVYASERIKPQPLVVDVELTLPLEQSACDETLVHTVDYAACAHQIAFLLRRCKFHTLETAAYVLCRYLLLPLAKDEQRAAIHQVRVKLTKPTALMHQAVPSIELVRDIHSFSYVHEQKEFGTVDIIHETNHAGIYRLNIAPQRKIPLHQHLIMSESEMVLTDGLLCQGELALPGSIRHWPKEFPHLYVNLTEKWQSILCIDEPSFTESDEVCVDGVAVKIEAESGWQP